MLGGLCVIPIVVGFLVIPSDKHYVATRNPNQNKQIDWLGGFLVTAGVCLLAFSLTQSGIADDGWKTPCEWNPGTRTGHIVHSPSPPSRTNQSRFVTPVPYR